MFWAQAQAEARAGALARAQAQVADLVQAAATSVALDTAALAQAAAASAAAAQERALDRLDFTSGSAGAGPGDLARHAALSTVLEAGSGEFAFTGEVAATLDHEASVTVAVFVEVTFSSTRMWIE
jgi:non-ribosomal peptide synthetase component F